MVCCRKAAHVLIRASSNLSCYADSLQTTNRDWNDMISGCRMNVWFSQFEIWECMCKSKLTDSSIINHIVQMKKKKRHVNCAQRKQIFTVFSSQAANISLNSIRQPFAKLLHKHLSFANQFHFFFFIFFGFVRLLSHFLLQFTFALLMNVLSNSKESFPQNYLQLCSSLPGENVPLQTKKWSNKQNLLASLSMQKYDTLFNLPKCTISQWATHKRSCSKLNKGHVIFFGLFMMLPRHFIVLIFVCTVVLFFVSAYYAIVLAIYWKFQTCFCFPNLNNRCESGRW